MRLLEVSIQNFKSLKSVTLKPGPLSVFIGPNGAGKSNLCEALDFIGEMYRSGLDAAMLAHGGYGAIVFRAPDDMDVPISLAVTAALSKRDRRPPTNGHLNDGLPRDIVVKHRLTISATPRGADAPYLISDESLCIEGKLKHKRSAETLVQIDRNDDGMRLTPSPFVREHALFGHSLDDDAIEQMVTNALVTRPFALLPTIVESLLLPTVLMSSVLGSIALYQLTPSALRQPGVPTTAPTLGRDGANLPAVLKWLEAHDPQAFHGIVNGVCVVDRSIEDLTVIEASQRSLELRFLEAGLQRLWSTREISDGTIRALGLFTALFDPRSSVVIIEEPENSLHAWSLGYFMDLCREASEQKQIILTTHSPVVVDQVRPENLWIVSKPAAESTVTELDVLDADARGGWEAGQFMLSDYLDSGILVQAVPVSPL